MSRLCLRRRNRSHAKPRRGANNSETTTSAPATRMIVGPVGRRSVRLLSTAPEAPAVAPKAADRTAITASESVHCLAAVAGATIIAAMSTTDIYWGAVPFLVIQILMVAMILAFPQIVGVHEQKQLEDIPLQLDFPMDKSNATPFEFNPSK